MAVSVVLTLAFAFFTIQATFAEQDFLAEDQLMKRDEVELLRHLFERLREVETKRASICGTLLMKSGPSAFYNIGGAFGEVRFQNGKLVIQFDDEDMKRLVDYRPKKTMTATELAAQMPFVSKAFQMNRKTYKLKVNGVHPAEHTSFCIEEQ